MRFSAASALTGILFLLLQGTVAAQDLGRIFGGIVEGAIEEQNRAEWARVSQDEQACMDRGLHNDGLNLRQIIRAGVSPNDTRISGVRSICQSLFKRKLRQNIDCPISTNSGVFTSKCDEDFASREDQKTRLSRLDVVEQAFSEQGVTTALFERPDAMSRREQMIANGTTSGTVVNPNFDCTKARSDADRTICNSAVLSALDLEYGDLYRRYRPSSSGRPDPVAKKVAALWKQRTDCGSSEECIKNNLQTSLDFVARVLRRKGEKIETSFDRARKIAAMEAERVKAEKQKEEREVREAQAREADAQRQAEADRRAAADRLEAERQAAEAKAKAEAERIAHLQRVSLEINDLVRTASEFLKSDKSNPRLLTIAEAIASATASLDTKDPDNIEKAKQELDRVVRDDPAFSTFQQKQAEARSKENARLLNDAISQARKQKRFLEMYIAENPTSAASKRAIDFVKTGQDVLASNDLRRLRAYIGSVQDLLRQYDLQENFLLSLNAVDDKSRIDGNPSPDTGLSRTSKNSFLLDGAPEDLVLMYVAAPSAPNVARNLKGDIVFDQSKAVVCIYQQGNAKETLPDRITNALQNYAIKNLLVQAQACTQDGILTNDVIAVRRGDFLKQEISYASALIKEIEIDHIKPLLSITASQIATTLQSIESKRKQIETDIEHSSLDGFAIVIFPAYPAGQLCGAVKDDLEAHEAIIGRFADPTIARLRQRLDLQNPSFESVFKKVQKSQCSAVYASSDDMRQLLTALRRDQVAYLVFEETISNDQIKTEHDLYVASNKAEEKAALDRQRQAQDADMLKAVRDRDLAASRQAQQTALRMKYEKIATSNAADISNDIKAFFDKDGLPKADEAGATVAYSYPALADWYRDAIREHWELQSVDSALEDYGSVDWKGRRLEAAFAVIRVRLKNAIVGEYRDGCFKAGRVIDHEFKMARDPVVVTCDDKDGLASWQLGHSFKSVWNLN